MLYDLTERVIPGEVLDAPTPSEDETLRTLALLAVRARGALTEPAIREHWRLTRRQGAPPRTTCVALVEQGLAARGRGRRRRRTVLRLCRTRSSAATRHRPCSSARSTTSSGTGRCCERVFGFRHVIEVYKREHERALRLLRAAAARRRPLPRPRRPEGRPRGGRAAHPPVPPGAEGARRTSTRSSTRGRSAARAHTRPRAGRTRRVNPSEVTVEEARRIAVHAQLLDGSATDVLDDGPHGSASCSSIRSRRSRRRSTSCSGAGSATLRPRPSSTACCGRSGKLVEWNAFLWPAEDLPLLQARMRRRDRPFDQRLDRLPEGERVVSPVRPARARTPRPAALARDRGPPPSRGASTHRWWGARKMGLMLEVLNARGEVAVVGRRGKQRVWDLAERWYPETERIPWARGEAAARGASGSARSACGSSAAGCSRIRMPTDEPPSRERGHVPLPFRPAGPRPRPRRTRCGTSSTASRCTCRRRSAQYGYYVLPILRGDRVIGRIEPVHDRKAGVLRVLGTWWEHGRCPCRKPLRSLARFLGASSRV